MKNYSEPSQPRLVQLDLLRALAVFLVLGNHLSTCPPETSLLAHKITQAWYYGGWTGVDLFFVLSGFLVSGLLFREYQKTETLNIKRFLIRRGLKIYPSFYILIAVTVLVSAALGREIPVKNLLAEIFFVQNFFGKLWPHTWSLAVEEHFYIGLAILAFLLLRFKISKNNPFSWTPHIFLFFAVVCFVLRALMAVYKGTSIGLTFFRVDALFFGVMISYFWHFQNLSQSYFLTRFKNWFFVPAVLLLLPAFLFLSVTNRWFFVFGMTSNYIAGGLLLLACLKSDFKNGALVRAISYVGAYSYSIYLWHLPFQYWVVPILTKLTGINNWFFFAGCYLAGSILFGILLSKIIEYPILRIRDRYFPPLSSALVQTAEK